MSDVKFSWRDEDPVSLIVLVLLALFLVFWPWQRCDPTSDLKAGPAGATQAVDVPVGKPAVP